MRQLRGSQTWFSLSPVGATHTRAEADSGILVIWPTDRIGRRPTTNGLSNYLLSPQATKSFDRRASSFVNCSQSREGEIMDTDLRTKSPSSPAARAASAPPFARAWRKPAPRWWSPTCSTATGRQTHQRDAAARDLCARRRHVEEVGRKPRRRHGEGVRHRRYPGQQCRPVRRPAGKPFLDIDEDEWDRVMKVNVRGTFQCAKAVAPIMMREQEGPHRQHRLRHRVQGHAEPAALCRLQGRRGVDDALAGARARRRTISASMPSRPV